MLSKSLNEAQKNYDTFKLELYALVKAVQLFQIYLFGAHFTVRTVNMTIRFYNTMSIPATNIIARWRAVLASFDYAIEHKASTQNGIADTLSRYPQKVPNRALSLFGLPPCCTLDGAILHLVGQLRTITILIINWPLTL